MLLKSFGMHCSRAKTRKSARLTWLWTRRPRGAVSAHLHLMTSEDGWHPEQVISAQAALDVIAAIEEMEGDA